MASDSHNTERDITERDLQADDILERMADAFIALDSQWRIVYANSAACRINQKPREAFLGKSHWDEWPGAVGTELETHLRAAMTGKAEAHFQHRYLSGPYDVWLEIDVYPASDGISLFYRDISERRQAEDALRRSREDLTFAVDAAHLGTFYCDWPLDKIIWNDTCKEHFFLPLDAEVDFNLFYSLLHPDDHKPTQQAIEQAMAQREAYDVEYRTLAPDGRTRWVNAVGRFYYGPDGQPTRFDGVTLDISARKATEDQLRLRAEREALLNRIGQAIRDAGEPEQVLEAAVRELGQALGADRCYYAVYDLDADTATVGPDWHRSGLPSFAGEYAMSEFAVNRDPQYRAGRTHVETDASHDLDCRAVGLTALVRVPLVSGTSMTALAVAMTGGPRQWQDGEVALVEAVATQTQTALASLRVRRREHAIAEQLAQALQPLTPSTVPGLDLADFYRPALEDQGVGGDFSDVFSADKGVTFLVVGDLSGKGLAAASEVAMVRHMLRFALYNGRTVAGPVASLNATLADHNLLSGFSTLFVGRYDAQNRTLTYVNCGQDAGLVLRAATGTIDTLPPTGLVLGAISGAAFTEATVTLETGDVLALYTDGLTEAGPSRTALLTGDGVANLLRKVRGERSAARIVARLMAGVDAYARRGVRDDQCLLVGVAR